jgi:hypothetical protein
VSGYPRWIGRQFPAPHEAGPDAQIDDMLEEATERRRPEAPT